MESIQGIEKIQEVAKGIREKISRIVIGQDEAIDLLLVTLISEGHMLMEGPPGTAKTMLARCFAGCVKLDFKRIQFTPDLMPGDVVGVNLFNFQTNSFTLTKGPIFTQFLLADEINRTPPKTQAALLEAMQERTVTIDGTSHELGDGFMVVATQNPIEQEGTYPLPEAQLDRFLFKILITYPDREAEMNMVRTHGHQTAMPDLATLGLTPVCDMNFISWIRQVLVHLRLSDETIAYIVDLVRATRTHPALSFGGSPRAANMLAAASRSVAVLEGRSFVIPDDIKYIFKPLMRHRVVLAPGAEVDGLSTDEVLEQIINQVPAPR